MKLTKLLLAGSLALVAASMASAQTKIKVTGSSAFRKSFYASVINSLTNAKAAYINTGTTGFASAGRAVITGNLIASGTSSGQAVVVQCCWAGSVGGIQAVSQSGLYVTTAVPTTTFALAGVSPAGQAWMADNANTAPSAISVNGSFVFTGGNNLAVGDGTTAYTITSSVMEDAAAADIAMSDSFQGSTLYPTPTLKAYKVGVVPFVWCKGSTNNTTVSAFWGTGGFKVSDGTLATGAGGVVNMEGITVVALLTSGRVPASFFTGNSGDSTTYVIAAGRDQDSGTRLVAQAESGFGIFSTSTLYRLNNTTSATGVLQSASGGTDILRGESSGGTLATQMNKPVSATATALSGQAWVPVCYVGISDAKNINSGNSCMSYNGVPYTDNNVRNGLYTFWGYEFLMHPTALTGTLKGDFASIVANQLTTTDAAAAGILGSTMNVQRTQEGASLATGAGTFGAIN